MTSDDDFTAAVLDQLAAHAAALAEADARIADLAGRVAALAAAAGADAGPGGASGGPGESSAAAVSYEPAPPRRWWNLTGPGKAEAAARLRGWVAEVYRPGYGHLAAGLGGCWEQHDLCLYGIDILAELWSVLYLTTPRTPALLSAQAEYHTRILPAVAAQLAAETSRCHHAAPLPARDTP